MSLLSEQLKRELLKRLEEIRLEIPISIMDQAQDIGIGYATLERWRHDKEANTPMRYETIRLIKDYIKKYEETK